MTLDHKLAVEEIGLGHAKAIIQLETQSKIEREEAMLRTEIDLTEQLNEEWIVRLKQEVDRVWEQSKALGKLELLHAEQMTLAIQTKMTDLEKDWNEEKAQQSRIHNDILIDRLQEQAAALDSERGRAVKLETSKWNQAVKDMEKR
jgi:hypothetical protein